MNLMVAREEMARRLQAQIDRGQELIARGDVLYDVASRTMPSNTIDISEWINECDRWHEFNLTLLESSFSTKTLLQRYRDSARGTFYHNRDTMGKIYGRMKAVTAQRNNLQSVLEQLPLLGEPSRKSSSKAATPAALPAPAPKTPTPPNKVFVVHGHDTEAKAEAARFLIELGLEPIILGEKPGESLTIIEKFEKHSDVAYAVVLLTPDDVGCSKAEYDKAGTGVLRGRARQNVIFELGYFFAKLGRGHVCALLKSDIEKPSDIDGVLYLQMDGHGAWRTKLASELKAAKLPLDNTRLLKALGLAD
jgi:predicted nucleotide-binding protein